MNQYNNTDIAAQSISEWVRKSWCGQSVKADDLSAQWEQLIPYPYYHRRSDIPDPREVRIVWSARYFDHQSARPRGEVGLVAPVGIQSSAPQIAVYLLSPSLKAAHRFHQGMQCLLASHAKTTTDISHKIRMLCTKAMLPDVGLGFLARFFLSSLPEASLKLVESVWTNLREWADMRGTRPQGRLFSGTPNLPVTIGYLIRHSLGTVDYLGCAEEFNPKILEIRPSPRHFKVAGEFFARYTSVSRQGKQPRAAQVLSAGHPLTILLGSETRRFWKRHFHQGIHKLTSGTAIPAGAGEMVLGVTDYPE